MTLRSSLLSQAISRENALLHTPRGWHALVHRAYDVIELAPRLAVGRVTRFCGLLNIECATIPVPAHVAWRLAAVARLSAHVCEVCGRRGRLIPAAEPIHWLVDDPNVLCAYHHWRQLEGDEVEQLIAEHVATTHAPQEIQRILIGDVGDVSPTEFRDALLHFGETQVASDGSGYVFEHRVAWILRHASQEQLRACRAEDLAPFFSWACRPLREAALEALTLLTPWPHFIPRQRTQLVRVLLDTGLAGPPASRRAPIRH